MNYLLAFLVLMVALAVLRILLMVVGVALLLTLVVAVIIRPRDTLVLLGGLGVLGLIVAQPIACIVTLGVVVLVSVVWTAKPETDLQALLTDGREHLGPTGKPPPQLPPTHL